MSDFESDSEASEMCPVSTTTPRHDSELKALKDQVQSIQDQVQSIQATLRAQHETLQVS